MSKSPKTVEGLRTALRELVPDQVESHTIQLSVSFYDTWSPRSFQGYVSYRANIEVQCDDVKFDATATASTPARLISAMKVELRQAAKRAQHAQQQKRLTQQVPCLER